MTRDPELAHRLRLAIDEERAAAEGFIDHQSLWNYSAYEAAQATTDALVEQVAATP